MHIIDIEATPLGPTIAERLLWQFKIAERLQAYNAANDGKASKQKELFLQIHDS